MKRIFLVLACIAVGVCAGMMLRECERPKTAYEPPGEGVRDTVTFVDTIPYLLPTPAKELAIGTRVVFVPVYGTAKADSCKIELSEDLATPGLAEDSVAVEIPITQREYEGEEYHAWVSGFEPRLDSIFIFPHHEVVTIREPPNKQKRWGIGVFAGYGYTAHGFQPCAGISINYNLWNF